MNKIEEYKREKDGLDVLADVPRYAEDGWEAITEGDRERLKWTGVFFRKQTPGRFNRFRAKYRAAEPKAHRGEATDKAGVENP